MEPNLGGVVCARASSCIPIGPDHRCVWQGGGTGRAQAFPRRRRELPFVTRLPGVRSGFARQAAGTGREFDSGGQTRTRGRRDTRLSCSPHGALSLTCRELSHYGRPATPGIRLLIQSCAHGLFTVL